jgi:hypothetical protein
MADVGLDARLSKTLSMAFYQNRGFHPKSAGGNKISDSLQHAHRRIRSNFGCGIEGDIRQFEFRHGECPQRLVKKFRGEPNVSLKQNRVHLVLEYELVAAQSALVSETAPLRIAAVCPTVSPTSW